MENWFPFENLPCVLNALSIVNHKKIFWLMISNKDITMGAREASPSKFYFLLSAPPNLFKLDEYFNSHDQWKQFLWSREITEIVWTIWIEQTELPIELNRLSENISPGLLIKNKCRKLAAAQTMSLLYLCSEQIREFFFLK